MQYLLATWAHQSHGACFDRPNSPVGDLAAFPHHHRLAAVSRENGAAAEWSHQDTRQTRQAADCRRRRRATAGGWPAIVTE
jgi:hypothetical protein